MEGNRLCSQCSTQPANFICICGTLPLLCFSCQPHHQTKPGFHFRLPAAALDSISASDLQKVRVKVFSLANSHEKLKDSLRAVNACRVEIESGYTAAIEQMMQEKENLLQQLEGLKSVLNRAVQEAIRETAENVHDCNYRPSSFLAKLTWIHCCSNSSDPLPIFAYHVKATDDIFRTPLVLTYETSVPQLRILNYSGRDIMLEIEDLEKKLRAGQARERKLMEKQAELKDISSRLDAELSASKGREKQLIGKVSELTEAMSRLKVELGAVECRERKQRRKKANLKNEVSRLEAQQSRSNNQLEAQGVVEMRLKREIAALQQQVHAEGDKVRRVLQGEISCCGVKLESKDQQLGDLQRQIQELQSDLKVVATAPRDSKEVRRILQKYQGRKWCAIQ